MLCSRFALRSHGSVVRALGPLPFFRRFANMPTRAQLGLLEEGASWATVEKVTREAPDVVRLDFRLDEPGDNGEGVNDGFAFRPGQWLDMFLDAQGITKVGGFSLTSSPLELPSFALTVKKSPNPPAIWCVDEAKIGDRVQCRPGGNFHWTAASAHQGLEAQRLLLVAGGIGVTPLYSMVRDFALTLAYLKSTGEACSVKVTVRVCLCVCMGVCVCVCVNV
jgi:hypothetical protein